MDSDRRAEIIQAVEWHDRDLLSEISLLQQENARLQAMLTRIADGLNTPWPFPGQQTEHDDLLCQSAEEAGRALQAIGDALDCDWSQWKDLSPAVDRLQADLEKMKLTEKRDNETIVNQLAKIADLEKQCNALGRKITAIQDELRRV